MPASSQASSSTRAAAAAATGRTPSGSGTNSPRPGPLYNGGNTKERVVSSATPTPTPTPPNVPSASKGVAFVELPGTSKDPFTPQEISSAVDQLLHELVDRQRAVIDRRETQLVDLYLMVRTLIRGQGFATMEDLLDGNGNADSNVNVIAGDNKDGADRQRGVKERLETQDREGLGMFLEEYVLKQGSVQAYARLVRIGWLNADL
jgi:hypothetical protein